MFPKPEGIPRSSGCYLFRNADETIIYVGKAKVLHQRLSSYFQKTEALTPKTQALMAEAASVDWIVTPSENDALLLENELIKVNQPRYNMRLKDDKTYPYVAIDSRTSFPVPYITRGKHLKGVRYYGPFVDVRSLRATMEELTQIFPLRSCTTAKYTSHQRRNRPCLLFDIGKCSGPCINAIDAGGYQELVAGWSRFFEGDVRQLRNILTTKMNEAAKNKKYEAAARFRDGLEALERADRTQSVILDDRTALDVITVATDGGRAAVVHFKVRHGRIVGRNVQMADRSLDETSGEIFDALVTSAFPPGSDIAATLLVDAETAHCEWAAHYLGEQRGKPVTVTVPERGRRLALLTLAQRDAQSVIGRDSLRRQSDHNVRARALQELGEALGLDQPPYRIECFDMSHLQGTNYVGSMVVFEDGLPIKNQYRHFNVKEILGNDDAGAMREVVRRRLGYWGEDVGTSKFRRANLLIIDGGLPQLHAAQSAAATVGVSDQVELVALAKREELLYRPGSSTPIALERGSESLYLVQRIRDEAHRFAISFHRSKRAKSMIATVLEGVDGLGVKRRERLLLEMGSLDNVRQATMEELVALPWLPERVAKNIYDHLRAPTAPQLRRERDID
jgi:excinuclease ABC subunit C